MTTAPPAVQIENLGKTFRDFWGRPRVEAVCGLDLAVEAGEVFGLLGPNGSGKSTTMKLMLGLLRPTTGSIRLLGAPPTDVAIKHQIGYLPEESLLYPHLTVEETLDFYGRLFGLTGPPLRRRADSLLERVGLSHARQRRAGECSKGMQRRLGIAQALINDPKLVVFDEPTAGLDPLGNREVKSLLRDLQEQGTSVMISSHLLADVEAVCDRIAILNEGRLVSLGAVDKLLADDRRTQIVTERLAPETVTALRSLIHEHQGPDASVEVGTPVTRLEDYFLRTVADPRHEMASPAVGKPATDSSHERENDTGSETRSKTRSEADNDRKAMGDDPARPKQSGTT